MQRFTASPDPVRRPKPDLPVAQETELSNRRAEFNASRSAVAQKPKRLCGSNFVSAGQTVRVRGQTLDLTGVDRLDGELEETRSFWSQHLLELARQIDAEDALNSSRTNNFPS